MHMYTFYLQVHVFSCKCMDFIAIACKMQNGSQDAANDIGPGESNGSNLFCTRWCKHAVTHTHTNKYTNNTGEASSHVRFAALVTHCWCAACSMESKDHCQDFSTSCIWLSLASRNATTQNLCFKVSRKAPRTTRAQAERKPWP